MNNDWKISFSLLGIKELNYNYQDPDQYLKGANPKKDTIEG